MKSGEKVDVRGRTQGLEMARSAGDNVVYMMSLAERCLCDDENESLSACLKLAECLEFVEDECQGIFDAFCSGFPYQAFMCHLVEYQQREVFLCLTKCIAYDDLDRDAVTSEPFLQFLLMKLAEGDDEEISWSLICLANISMEQPLTISYLLRAGILEILGEVDDQVGVFRLMSAFCSCNHEGILPCMSFMEQCMYLNDDILEIALIVFGSLCVRDPELTPAVYSLLSKSFHLLFASANPKVMKRFLDIMLLAEDLPLDILVSITNKVAEFNTVPRIVAIGCNIMVKNHRTWKVDAVSADFYRMLFTIIENMSYDTQLSILSVLSAYYTPAREEVPAFTRLYIEHLLDTDASSICVFSLLKIARECGNLPFIEEAAEPLMELLETDDTSVETCEMISELLTMHGLK